MAASSALLISPAAEREIRAPACCFSPQNPAGGPEKIYKCAMQSYSKLYADTGIVEVKRVRHPRREFDPQALD
jgi:hypothetical protein